MGFNEVFDRTAIEEMANLNAFDISEFNTKLILDPSMRFYVAFRNDGETRAIDLVKLFEGEGL